MKKTTQSLTVALLTLVMASSALADRPRGPYSHHPHRGQYERHHNNTPNGVAPLLFLGLAGAVMGAAASQPSPPPPQAVYVPPPITYVQPAPVYVAPPVAMPAPAPQPAHAWYFCRSVGQYYPYTPNCPEPWQLVSPTPQQ
nr:hypothetical protein [uncultured Rhodoferax sp.]